MTYHEFGKENEKVIMLIHPAVVMWDYFEYVIPLLEKDYHLIIPALQGYDPENKSDFTSIEEIAEELERWLGARGMTTVECICPFIEYWFKVASGLCNLSNKR